MAVEILKRFDNDASSIRAQQQYSAGGECHWLDFIESVFLRINFDFSQQ